MLGRLLVFPALAGLLSGCGAANASAPDTSNPYHCGVAFSMFYGMAKSSGSEHATDMHRRMTWEAEKAKALPASSRSKSEGEALMERLMADQKEAAATVFACMQNQDADPAFRAARAHW